MQMGLKVYWFGGLCRSFCAQEKIQTKRLAQIAKRRGFFSWVGSDGGEGRYDHCWSSAYLARRGGRSRIALSGVGRLRPLSKVETGQQKERRSLLLSR